MKKLPAILFCLSLLLFVFSQPISAQTSTGSATLPQTGIETPLLIIGGTGLALFGSGFLFKKLQSP